jgi:hypothetical protein
MGFVVSYFSYYIDKKIKNPEINRVYGTQFFDISSVTYAEALESL